MNLECKEKYNKTPTAKYKAELTWVVDLFSHLSVAQLVVGHRGWRCHSMSSGPLPNAWLSVKTLITLRWAHMWFTQHTLGRLEMPTLPPSHCSYLMLEAPFGKTGLHYSPGRSLLAVHQGVLHFIFRSVEAVPRVIHLKLTTSPYDASLGPSWLKSRRQAHPDT